MKHNKTKPIRPSRPKPTWPILSQRTNREEGGPSKLSALGGRGELVGIKPSRPNPQKIAEAVAPILRSASPERVKALDEIVRLSGERPDEWTKPPFGDFEYWLAHKCGWINDEELAQDQATYDRKRQKALDSSHRFSRERFSWMETPRYEEPPETGEYVPAIDMKLVRDRNLTDSARRVACFVLRHAYQDNRKGRFVAMTVTFIMKGLALSRRTVQRSLTLLETRGYFRCEVAKGSTTKMCVGLIIHLMQSLMPRHHKENWPEKRGNREASSMPQKKIHLYKTILGAKEKVSRLTWALKCMNGVARKAFQVDPVFGSKGVPACRGFKTLGTGFLHPSIRTMAHIQQGFA